MKTSGSKLRTCVFMSFFFLLLLFFFTISLAARPVPVPSSSSSLAVPIKTAQHKVNYEEEESCEGVGEEECLMRRTLAAHLDYIYTQKHKPAYRP